MFVDLFGERRERLQTRPRRLGNRRGCSAASSDGSRRHLPRGVRLLGGVLQRIAAVPSGFGTGFMGTWLNGYPVLQGTIPLRTSQFKHIRKLLARERLGTPSGLSTRLAGADGSSPECSAARSDGRSDAYSCGFRPRNAVGSRRFTLGNFTSQAFGTFLRSFCADSSSLQISAICFVILL